MITSPGNSLRNPSSTATSGTPLALPAGLAVCAAAGIVAALIDLELHVPLRMPGWRGLIVVALLVAARRVSARGWGATGAAFCAAVTSLVLAGPPQFGTLSYLAPGVAIDAMCWIVAGGRTTLLGASLGGALGNVLKLAVSLLGVGLAARHGGGGGGGGAMGSLFPWLAHLAFGLVGGLVAAVSAPKPRP
jgi:hypothetical protein